MTISAIPASSVDAFGYKQELKRSLTLSDLLVYGLVFIVPIAPVPVFGIVYNASHGMVPLIYLVGLVAMLFIALSYMALSRAFPVAGSVYTYASRSIGPAAGFIAGWAILLAVFMSVGVYALGHGAGGAHLSLAPFYNPAELTPSLIFGAPSLAVLSFLGFDAISTLSEETKGGPDSVSRATMLSLCISAILFVAQTYLASLFVLDRTSFAPGDETDAAFYGIASTIGGYWLKFLLTVPGVLFAGIAGALTAQAATARLLYGMARDGQLPHLLSRVHPTRKVPHRCKQVPPSPNGRRTGIATVSQGPAVPICGATWDRGPARQV